MIASVHAPAAAPPPTPFPAPQHPHPCRLNAAENARGCAPCVTVHPEAKSVVAGAGKAARPFSFDGVFGTGATQEDVYDGSVAPLAASFLGGYNATIMAYGQTGSGKTHTMMGYAPEGSGPPAPGALMGGVDESCLGIIPRLMRDLLEAVAERNAGGSGPDGASSSSSPSPSSSTRLSVSYLEIYNERVRDLLLPEGVPEPDRGFTLQKDKCVGGWGKGRGEVGGLGGCLLRRQCACCVAASTVTPTPPLAPPPLPHHHSAAQVRQLHRGGRHAGGDPHDG